MKIHEYQGKKIFRENRIAVPEGIVIETAESAASAYEKLGAGVVAVKAQIHAGGRGKGILIPADADGQKVYDALSQAEHHGGPKPTGMGHGHGVMIATSASKAVEHAKAMFGSKLITIQTGPEGRIVRKVLIEAGVAVNAPEYTENYVGIVLDRALGLPVLMASSKGGTSIEVVAHETPELIIKEYFRPEEGLAPYQARKVAYKIGLKGEHLVQGADFMENLAALYVKYDCSTIEINPLATLPGGVVTALDSKVVFEDDALERHVELKPLRDISEEEPDEKEAQDWGLSFVSLDGNIGCLVNGAGLAMATMDIIKFFGGEPKNFLDVGGGASEEKVTAAFTIILKDPKVRAIFVNIFGGILRCDLLANGIIAAAKKVGLTVPLVVRLRGSFAEEGKAILKNSDLKIYPATTMEEGAQLAIQHAGGKVS
jgi:succinyl-CoA synthetase beta subunit